MIALDTSFILDYLDGRDAAADYVADHGNEPHFAPTLALFEVYRGAARSAGREGVERVTAALDWLEPLPLDEPAAREAALIEAELLAVGERIDPGDALVAGVCRRNGARIVTRDRHFERVEKLEVEEY